MTTPRTILTAAIYTAVALVLLVAAPAGADDLDGCDDLDRSARGYCPGTDGHAAERDALHTDDDPAGCATNPATSWCAGPSEPTPCTADADAVGVPCDRDDHGRLLSTYRGDYGPLPDGDEVPTSSDGDVVPAVSDDVEVEVEVAAVTADTLPATGVGSLLLSGLSALLLAAGTAVVRFTRAGEDIG